MVLFLCLLFYGIPAFAAIPRVQSFQEECRQPFTLESYCLPPKSKKSSKTKVPNMMMPKPPLSHLSLNQRIMSPQYTTYTPSFSSSYSSKPKKVTTCDKPNIKTKVKPVKKVDVEDEIITVPWNLNRPSKSALKTPKISPKLSEALKNNKSFGDLPMRHRIRKPDTNVPVDFTTRFEFYRNLYVINGDLTPLIVKNLKPICDPVPLKPKPNINDFYRTIDMPDETASITTLLEAAVEWYYFIGSKLGKGWDDPDRLTYVITKITEREQEEIFNKIKPPKVNHAWYEFASQKAHHDFRLNSALHMCQRYIQNHTQSGTRINELRFGFEQTRVFKEFTIPERLAAAKFARLTRYELRERLLPGKFPNRIRPYEKKLSISDCPSKHIHQRIWIHAIIVYFRTRIEQHFRKNVFITKLLKHDKKFLRYPSSPTFPLKTVGEWQHAWMLLSSPLNPMHSYQAVWVMSDNKKEYRELNIIWGRPSNCSRRMEAYNNSCHR